MTATERINIREEADGITVQIRPKKVWAAVVHILFMMVVLLVGGLLIIYGLSKREQAIGSFMTVWLFILAVFSVINIPAFLWNLFGQEIISIRGGVFTHKLAVGEYGLKKTFHADELFNLRTSRLFDDRFKEWDERGATQLGLGDRKIAVDTKYEKLHKFGIRLEEDEAVAVARALEPYLPSARFLISIPLPDRQ